MSARDSLNRLVITSPCFSDWGSMVGNDQVRFCEHCNLKVHNISEMTRIEAARLVANSQGRLCVRYYQDANGAVITRQPPSRIRHTRRRVSQVTASAFGAAIGLSPSVVQPSVTPSQPGYRSQAQDPGRWVPGANLVGTITDADGAVIPGATIALSNDETKLMLFTTTNHAGGFNFEGLVSGLYRLRIEAPGFAATEAQTYLQASGETRVDRTLNVATIEADVEIEGTEQTREFVTMGVVAYVAPSDPFVKAAQEDDLVAVEALIAGSDVNLRDKRSGTTALDHAVGNSNREMVQLLLSKGANVNAQNASGQTVLMMLGADSTSDLVWDLINAGAEVNLQDKNGNTALIHAASINNPESIKTLLEAGAKVGSKSKEGETALMMASSNGLINNVRALVLAGSNFSEQDDEGRDALAYAIENEHKVVIRFLRSQGALEGIARAAREK